MISPLKRVDVDLLKFRSILAAHDMTYAQLAEEIGTSAPTVCRYVRGKRKPCLCIVERIEDVLGLPRSYLLLGD